MENRFFQYLVGCLLSLTLPMNATIYTRLTNKPTNGWAGDYLIVYEAPNSKAYVWDGTDDSKNYTQVTITNGQITSDALTSSQVKIASENSNYSIKASDGYIYVEAKDNGIEFGRGAYECTISSNGGYALIEANNHTCRFVYQSRSDRFRFYYDKDKQWASTDYHNVYLYAVGDLEQEERPNALDINYAQADMFACDSKFPTTSNPYDQYFFTTLRLLQAEDEEAVPQVFLEILAPTQYSIEGTYKSIYTPNQKGYLNITAGSSHSTFIFPSRAESGYSEAAITVADMTITKVGPSDYPNAYVYHIKLEFTDSNRKIWHLDKDLDVYATWTDCDRSDPHNPEDMPYVEFALESGNHNPQTGLHQVTGDRWQVAKKVIIDGQVYLLINGEYYSILGNKIK